MIDGTLFGRPVVRSWRHPDTFEVTVMNDQGQKMKLSEEQLRQLHQIDPSTSIINQKGTP